MSERTFHTSDFRKAADSLHPEAKPIASKDRVSQPKATGPFAETQTELWNRAEYAEFVLERTKKRLARVERSRNWGWSLFVIALVFALMLLARVAIAEDCLNRDLSTAVGDALVIAKHQGGHARVRYLTLYAVPEAKRLETIAGISALCHQLSHAGVAIQPHKIAPSVWRLDLNAFDPHDVGWAKGWEQIVAHDRRYHYGDLAPADASTTGRIFVGSTVEVRCNDGNFYPAKVVELFNGGYFFEINGRRFSSAKNVVREPKAAVVAYSHAYGDWVDYSAAKLLQEITGSAGAILDGREFARYASYTNTYYVFRNSPKTLTEWLRNWGEFEPQGFGKVGVRGVNLDVSGVTHTVRGLERRRLPVWVTFDNSKAFDLTEDFDAFALANRTHKINATEALAITPAGGLDCFIADGSGNRVDAVPPAVAIDTSHGIRELRPGLSCWSCHSRNVGGKETSGFLAFGNDQIKTSDFVKAPKLAAELAAYYGSTETLVDDMERDRATFRRGCGYASGFEPSKAFSVLNDIVDEVNVAGVSPERACRELCLTVEGSAAETLSKWLNGTTNKTLVQLMNGQDVNYQRFRLCLNEALHHIHQRRVFAK